jgi:hypothetical protein
MEHESQEEWGKYFQICKAGSKRHNQEMEQSSFMSVQYKNKIAIDCVIMNVHSGSMLEENCLILGFYSFQSNYPVISHWNPHIQ